MNISFDLYKYFFFVCEFKSITKAANFLCITQPALSKQMRQLETYVGKKLFLKTKSGIELTSDGMELYEDVKSSIEQLNRLEGKYNDKQMKFSQTIRIVAGHLTTKNLLLDSIANFNKKYPMIKFELLTYHYEEAIQLLHEGKCDLIFFCMNEVGEVPSNIVIKKIADVHEVFVVGREFQKKLSGKLTVDDFSKYPIICKEEIYQYYYDRGIDLKPTYLLTNNWLVEEYAIRNLGIGIVTKEYIKDELDSGLLQIVFTDIKPLTREMAYAYRDNSVNYDIIREITEQLLEDLKERE